MKDKNKMVRRKIALIGSFRQHYESVLNTLHVLTSKGHEITTPLGTAVIKEGIPFVRFESDSKFLNDCEVQTIALHRILRADVVYVVAPGGYVGRTTCYEIGRIIQARQPIYFSEKPCDLPIMVAKDRIFTPEEFLHTVSRDDWDATPIFDEILHPNDAIEKDLLYGIYREV